MKYLLFIIPAISIACILYIGFMPMKYKLVAVPAHEYQMDIADSGYSIYDGSRFVGFVPYDTNPTLDSLMLFDNL